MWDDKRYHSLNYYIRKNFNHKLYKLSLNGGMTCPNRDGKIDTRGCIFCSEGGSGEFATPHCFSITEQIQKAKEQIAHKVNQNSEEPQYIAYFQAFTNTYAPITYLRKIFTEAINNRDIAVLSIATRPDCINDDILDLLEELNAIKPVWIELGLQTIHEKTAWFIRRGYPLSVFDQTVTNLKARHIDTIVHLIIGLPYETDDDILKTVQYVSQCGVMGVKLQLLHVLKGTDLENYVDSIRILSMEEYVNLVITCLEHLDPAIVIHRITGDGPKDLLLAPLWSLNKKKVLNAISHTMKERDSWQGKYC